jgi:hypothetical protein
MAGSAPRNLLTHQLIVGCQADKLRNRDGRRMTHAEVQQRGAVGASYTRYLTQTRIGAPELPVFPCSMPEPHSLKARSRFLAPEIAFSCAASIRAEVRSVPLKFV